MLKAMGPKGLVLLSPGGNFGDLWRGVHEGRLRYLKQFAAGYGTVHNWTVSSHTRTRENKNTH
jgi:exopolysaccharide biosynthesis predicted pyruvyltransferase EpsI